MTVFSDCANISVGIMNLSWLCIQSDLALHLQKLISIYYLRIISPLDK